MLSIRESLPTKMEKLCYAKFLVVKPINIDSVGRFQSTEKIQPTTF